MDASPPPSAPCLPAPQDVEADGPAFTRLMRIVLAALAILPAGLILKLIFSREKLFPDFFALWSFGRYLLAHPARALYDAEGLHAFQVSLGLPAETLFPFYYPPVILLILAPLGLLPYVFAFAAWMAVTLAGYALALRVWRWPPSVALALLLAPSTAACMLCGQNGFLTAALMLGGVGLLGSRPFVAGLLLGALIYKPQLAVLVPFLLLFGRRWRAMAGAAASVLCLAALAGLLFGPGVWRAWVTSFGAHAAGLADGRRSLFDLTPTVTSAVLLLGGSPGLARVAQLAGAALGLVALWRVRTRTDLEAQAALPLATILATPYAFDYDLPMTTGALLLVIAGRVRSHGRFGALELSLLLLCLFVPAILFARLGAASSAAPVLFGLALFTLTSGGTRGEAPAAGSFRPGDAPRLLQA